MSWLWIGIFTVLGCAMAFGLVWFGWAVWEQLTGRKSPYLFPPLFGRALDCVIGEAYLRQSLVFRVLDYRDHGAKGLRVFESELREWPEVHALRSGNGYILKARHAAPDRAVWTGRMPFVTAFAAFVLVASYTDGLIVAIGSGIVAGLASMPVWINLLKKTATLNFNDAVIFWDTPEGTSAMVERGEEFEARVQLPHRLAQEEIRVHQNFLRRNPTTKKQPKSVYQLASEVIIHTGVGKRDWLTVAAIADDESGEKAHKLQTAIEFVAGVVRAEAPAKTSQPVPALPGADAAIVEDDDKYE